MTRKCNQCRQEKALTYFYKHKGHPLGRAYTCKLCVLILVKAWSGTVEGKARTKISRRKYRKSKKGRARELERGHRPENKIKAAVRRKHYRASLRGRSAEFRQLLSRSYGITLEDWARLYDKQRGKCAACNDPLLFDRSTHVDHSHATGKVRGLLCRGCNVALGGVQDRLSTLRGLIIYLEAAC